MTLLIDPSKAAYVVIDMETTGLEPHTDVPLELGIGVFDEDLNELAMNSWLIRPEDWRIKLHLNAYVEEMHTKNGLISDIQALPETYTEIDAEGKQHILNYGTPMVSYLAWKWLTHDLGLESAAFPMTGSSISSLDRPFMKKYMPSPYSFFTYRTVDISSLKELCKRHNKKLYEEMKSMPEFLDANKKHRVRDDVRASARELKFYLDNFLHVQPKELADVPGQLPLFDHPV